MNPFITLFLVTIVFLALALFGLAIKTIIKEHGSLSTCSGTGNGSDCNCSPTKAEKSEKQPAKNLY